MKYKIKDLMSEFKQLGCSVGDFGYPIIPDDDFEDILIGELFRSLDNNRQAYIKMVQNASPEEKAALQVKYNEEQQAYRDEIDKLHYQEDSSKARAIYNLIELAQKLHQMGIDVEEEISKDDLDKLFVLLGGRISDSEYEIPETPDSIKAIEAEIDRLYKENYQAADPFTLLDTNEKVVEEFMLENIHKINDLRDQLKQEINKHPEYKKIKAVLDAIKAIEELEKFNAPQKVKGE